MNSKVEPSPGLSLGTPHGGRVLGRTKGGLVVELCQGPVNVSIKASLNERNGILKIIKKEKLRSSNLMMLPGSRIKDDRLKYKWGWQPILTQHFPDCHES